LDRWQGAKPWGPVQVERRLAQAIVLHEWAMLAGIGRQVLASGMDVA